VDACLAAAALDNWSQESFPCPRTARAASYRRPRPATRAIRRPQVRQIAPLSDTTIEQRGDWDGRGRKRVAPGDLRLPDAGRSAKLQAISANLQGQQRALARASRPNDQGLIIRCWLSRSLIRSAKTQSQTPVFDQRLNRLCAAFLGRGRPGQGQPVDARAQGPLLTIPFKASRYARRQLDPRLQAPSILVIPGLHQAGRVSHGRVQIN
jgi:hypothetical protein